MRKSCCRWRRRCSRHWRQSGEDHEDDWWEYYGTAQFDRYRQAQTRMLEFNFPYFLAGRRSLEQAGGTQSNGNDQYVCLHTRVDFAKTEQVSNYVNSEGRSINGVYPFGGGLFNDIPSEIKRPEK